jgi:UrcA family protein
MNRNKFPMAGAVAAALATAVMVPCYAGSAASTPVPTVRIEANSLKSEPVSPARPVGRVELSAQVKAKDLNLARPRDVARLERRIENAAQQVCTQLGTRYPWLVDSTDQADRAACVRGAVDDALSQAKVAALMGPMRGRAEASRAG